MLLINWLGIFLFGLFIDASPQALTYDIVVNDQTVGQMQVASLPTASGMQYQVNADVRMRLLGERRMITNFTSTYQNNQLTEARFHDQLNGKTRHDALVRWDGMGYRIRVNGEQSQLTNRRVTYSTAILYAQEPQGIRELFSERFGQFCQLKPLANHTYELTMPDGRKSLYHYSEGICQKIEAQQALFTVHFRLRHP